MSMRGRRRLERQRGLNTEVDGIHFDLPVESRRAPVFAAAFPCDAAAATRLLPGGEVHPLRLWNRALLVVTVINYQDTVIGSYIEYSIAIACTHGRRPAPRLLPALFQGLFGVGQFVLDLPVSTEVSVKGGKGIWGMPKHQGNLDFVVGQDRVGAQYDLDGKLCLYVEIDKPKSTWLPLRMPAANYCAFRGMLMKSYIYFRGKAGTAMFGKARARLVIGDHPRMAWMRDLDIASQPLFTAWMPDSTGMLDDYMECWFLRGQPKPVTVMDGLASVATLGQGREWLAPPSAAIPGLTKPTVTDRTRSAGIS